MPSRCSTPCSIRISISCADGVAVLRCLTLGVIERDRDVAQETKGLPGRKRQHIGGVIFLAKLAVQPLQLRITRNQAGERAPAGHFRFQALGERAGQSVWKVPAWRNGIAE